MKMNGKLVVMGLCMCMCLGGCAAESKETKAGAEPETARELETGSNVEAAGPQEAGAASESQAPGQTEESADRSRSGDFFPESYSFQTEKVKFECALEVPEDFDASNFHIPAVKGCVYPDADAIYANYVEGKTVVEEHHDGSADEDRKRSDAYILEDETLIGITEGFIYHTPKAGIYQSIGRTSELGAPKDTFDFAAGQDCVLQAKEELAAIGCPVEEYRFDWFSTSGEEYAALEQQAVEAGLLDSQNVRAEGWTEADDSYEIYAWQTYEGLQVILWAHTTSMYRAFENYTKAPVNAIYTREGRVGLSMTEPPYLFEPAEEPSEFRPFSEIADVLVQKYEDMLDEAVYTVTRAKLVLRAYLDESQQPGVEPAWYFEVSDGNSVEVAMVNAVTAKEIYLP